MAEVTDEGRREKERFVRRLT
jgi:hypothetical protein